MTAQNFIELVKTKTFSKSSKVAKLLTANGCAVEIAVASKTTKPYKEDSVFAAAVDNLIKNGIELEKIATAPAPVPTNRSGERR